MSFVAVNKLKEDFADIALSRDQLILRIGGMTIVSEESGEQAFLRVRRKFSLTGPQSPSVNRQDGREQPISLIGNGAEVEHKPRQQESKMAPSRSDSDPLPGLIRFAEWAEDAIAGQRNDISRISTIVSKIEKDMRSFKDFMIETRRDLATVPGGKPWASMKRSVTLLEEEMGSLRTELEARPGGAYPGVDNGVKLSAEELDVLTSSITKISQKVNEVESLKMELQFMKTRLKRFEEGARTVKQAVDLPAKENLPTPVPNPSSNTPRLPRSVRRAIEPRTQESMPERPSNPNLNTRRSNGIVRGISTEWDYTRTPMSETRTRKRKSEEYEGDFALEIMAASAVNSQKKGMPVNPTLTDPHHNPYWKVNHGPGPSRLSNVQHVDEIPDSLNPDLSFFAEKFTDGNNSEGDRRRRPASTKDREREYDSAPESRPARRKTQLVHQNNNLRRDSSTSEEPSPPRAKNSRLQALQKMKIPPRRRAYYEGQRNADGVRLTKKGAVDRRTGNYKYLKQYYEKLRTQKEQEAQGQEKESGEGGEGGHAMPSIEAGATAAAAAQMQEEDNERERLEIAKQAELEARDRLVRETLERELGV
jgi:hypothetical protein